MSKLQYHLSLKSSNAKTGPIPVSTTESKSCPDSCPLKFERDDQGEIKLKKDGSPVVGACYAKTGPLSWHWGSVDKGKRGTSFREFLKAVKSFVPGQLWRHNQAGDLPGIGEEIDLKALEALVAANGDSKGFTYTHKKQALRTADGLKAVQDANSKGFTINVSADNIAEVDEFRALGLPVTVTIPEDSKGFTTPNGNKVKVCPAQLSDRVNCSICGLCQIADRPHVVGFQAHGAKSGLIELS